MFDSKLLNQLILLFQNYLGFKTEFDKRQKIFLRLKEKEVSKRAEKNSPKIWQELEPKWRDIARRTREWLKNLDASLPSSLGVIGEWINFAEEMLEIEPKNVENHIEMADQLLELSNEHKVWLLVTIKKSSGSCYTAVRNRFTIATY